MKIDEIFLFLESFLQIPDLRLLVQQGKRTKREIFLLLCGILWKHLISITGKLLIKSSEMNPSAIDFFCLEAKILRKFQDKFFSQVLNKYSLKLKFYEL